MVLRVLRVLRVLQVLEQRLLFRTQLSLPAWRRMDAIEDACAVRRSPPTSLCLSSHLHAYPCLLLIHTFMSTLIPHLNSHTPFTGAVRSSSPSTSTCCMRWCNPITHIGHALPLHGACTLSPLLTELHRVALQVHAVVATKASDVITHGSHRAALPLHSVHTHLCSLTPACTVRTHASHSSLLTDTCVYCAYSCVSCGTPWDPPLTPSLSGCDTWRADAAGDHMAVRPGARDRKGTAQRVARSLPPW
jgi:hypothetical protein